MSRQPTNPSVRPSFQELPFLERIKLVDKFFEGRDEVHKSLRRLVKRLDAADIAYVVVGGMAVFAHGYRRTTNDVDILLTAAGFAEFRKRYVPRNYTAKASRPQRLTDKTNQITVDVLVTGLFPGNGRAGPIAYPDPADVCERMHDVATVNLVTLVQLKLAARRFQDFADVVHLIRANKLSESYLKRLHPSLHRDFIECLEEKRREDEYEARNG